MNLVRSKWVYNGKCSKIYAKKSSLKKYSQKLNTGLQIKIIFTCKIIQTVTDGCESKNQRKQIEIKKLMPKITTAS